MKAFNYILLLLLLYSCSNILNCEKQKIFNPKNGEVIYLKYCLYGNGHEATFISLDSIYKDPVDSINEYICYHDYPIYFYKLSKDTLNIYCYCIFEIPKEHRQFKTIIKMVDMGFDEWDNMKKDYKKLGLKVFPSCHFNEKDTVKVDD